MSDDHRPDELRRALSRRADHLEGLKRGNPRGRAKSTSLEEDIATAEKVIDRQGIDAAAKFLARRSGLSATTCKSILQGDRENTDRLETTDGLESAIIDEAMTTHTTFGGMTLMALERMKRNGQHTGDMQLSDEDIDSAAVDLLEIVEMLCLGDVNPMRVFEAACEKGNLLRDDPASGEFFRHVRKAAKDRPLSADIRRIFP